MYDVQILKSALKDLSKLPPKETLRITQKIIKLKADPRPKGCVKIRVLTSMIRSIK